MTKLQSIRSELREKTCLVDIKGHVDEQGRVALKVEIVTRARSFSAEEAKWLAEDLRFASELIKKFNA